MVSCGLVEGASGENSAVPAAWLRVCSVPDPGPKFSFARAANESCVVVDRSRRGMPGTMAEEAGNHFTHVLTLPPVIRVFTRVII